MLKPGIRAIQDAAVKALVGVSVGLVGILAQELAQVAGAEPLSFMCAAVLLGKSEAALVVGQVGTHLMGTHLLAMVAATLIKVPMGAIMAGVLVGMAAITQIIALVMAEAEGAAWGYTATMAEQLAEAVLLPVAAAAGLTVLLEQLVAQVLALAEDTAAAVAGPAFLVIPRAKGQP
jgi:hypothetical protein